MSSGRDHGPPGHRKPKHATIKNKTAAQIQITSEQILREAKERLVNEDFVQTTVKFDTPEELKNYQTKKRADFENQLRRNKMHISHWYKYAEWEEKQGELERARSVWNRAIDVDYKNHSLWLRFAEMEMRNKQINHARNVFVRCTKLLPRVEQLWLKWTIMEETMNNVAACREVFERWMQTSPPQKCWQTYVKFELRYKEIEHARKACEDYIKCHPGAESWLYFAKIEERHGDLRKCRQVFERCVEAVASLGLEFDEQIFLNFAAFEERAKEFDRARAILKFALDNVQKGKALQTFDRLQKFEKQYGSTHTIEEAVLGKKRFEYEQELKENGYNYDAWFEYVRLEENNFFAVDASKQAECIHKVREVYERAIAVKPQTEEKRYWTRYMYLFLMYASFTELYEENSIERVRQIFELCLNIIPHASFSFGKVWIAYAQFEIRQKELTRARKILGTALGKAPKDKIFRCYIDLESQLGNLDNTRKIYEKWLLFNPNDSSIWIRYATLESNLEEETRAREIFRLATQQELDLPENLWKEYIDWEVKKGEFENARKLYKTLLEKTRHLKVYFAYAIFEANVAKDIPKARAVFESAYKEMNRPETREECTELLNNWEKFEEVRGTPAELERVRSLKSDQAGPRALGGLLAKAAQWKKLKTQ